MGFPFQFFYLHLKYTHLLLIQHESSLPLLGSVFGSCAIFRLHFNKPTQFSQLSHITALPLPQAHFCSKPELTKYLFLTALHQSNSRGFGSSAPNLPRDSVTCICILSLTERAGVGLSSDTSASTSFQC